MGLALYRKYRPATFAEVVGQEHVTEPLMTAVDSGRINHAYLFSGPRGCGKTSSARILARSLNCEQGPTSTPCGLCQSCIDLAPDGSGNIDVIEIDAASHGGVDDARELRERAFQLPVASRYKIYIIDEAHMVSNQGFNALLKVVEEPPDSVVFIFATTEPDKVLPTIRSRTHHYPFRLVPPPAMRTLLEKNCKSEGVTVQNAVIPLVVRAGGGSVRDSQSLLDQLISGAGPDGITYESALALLGVTDAALLDDMIEAIAAVDGATVFGTVNRLVDAGHDPRRFGADLLDRLRDLILMAAVPDAGPKGLIDAPGDQVERMADQADRIGLSTLSRLADIVHVGLTEMRGTTTPRLGLELICARMLLPQASGDGGALVQRVDRLERRMSIGGSQPTAEAPATVPEPRPVAARPRPERPAPRRPGEPSRRERAEAALAQERLSTGPVATESTAPPESTAPLESTAATEPAVAEPTPPAERDERRARPAEKTPDNGGWAVPGVTNPGTADWPEVVPPGSRSKKAVPDKSGGDASTPPAAAHPQAPTPATAPPPVPAAQPSADSEPDLSRDSEPEPRGASEPEPPRASEPESPRDSEPQAAPSTSRSASPPQRPQSIAGGDFDVAELRRQWPTIVDALKKHSRAVAALVEAATASSVSDGTLTVITPPGLVRRLSDPSQHGPLSAVLEEVLGVSWDIRVVARDDVGRVPAEPEPEDESEPDPDDQVIDRPTAGSVDPESAAMALLQEQLGAKLMDE